MKNERPETPEERTETPEVDLDAVGRSHEATAAVAGAVVPKLTEQKRNDFLAANPEVAKILREDEAKKAARKDKAPEATAA